MKARHMRLSEEQSVCLTNNGKTYLTWSDICSLTAMRNQYFPNEYYGYALMETPLFKDFLEPV